MEFYPYFQAALLGVVEGATEFLPVSSTGHLILAQTFLGFTGRKANAFAVFIQLGAILAIVWVYRRKLSSLVLDWRRDAQARGLLAKLILGTLPAALVGLPTEKWIETHFFQPLPVSLALIIGGLLILFVERIHGKNRTGRLDQVSAKRALGVGAFQVLAVLFPGLSRSGATIVGGLVLGLSRTAATEFSFLLAIPALGGASLVKLGGVVPLLEQGDLIIFSIGFLFSFVSAMLVVKWLLNFVARKSFISFAWYRMLLGLVLLILLFRTDL